MLLVESLVSVVNEIEKVTIYWSILNIFNNILKYNLKCNIIFLEDQVIVGKYKIL